MSLCDSKKGWLSLTHNKGITIIPCIINHFFMHCILSYDVYLEAGEERQHIEDEIKTILSDYTPNVRRLTTFYVIHIASRADWDTLLRRLSELSNSNPGALHFIMSPPMDGGRYNGILPRTEWDEINRITEMQD